MRVRNVKESAAHDYTLRELKLSKVGQVSILSYFRDFGNCLWYATPGHAVTIIHPFIHSLVQQPFIECLLCARYSRGTAGTLQTRPTAFAVPEPRDRSLKFK